MRYYATIMAAYEITGNIQKRFIENAVLLHLLDPVRGSPTANSLDRNADPGESRESVLKRKFLDSLALVASTHKNGDKVSAATLEEGAPDGTVVRVASNAGVCDSTLFRLQDLMSDLNEIAATAELLKVRSKIADTERVLSRLALGFEPDEVQQFSSWISSFKAIAAVISADASPSQLLPHVIWAEKAKWEYSKYLDVAFSAQGSQPPRFIYSLYKLGRYAVASRALCQLASEFPALFCPMRIETVRPFPKVRFSLPNTERPLSRVLRRVIGEHEQEFATRMASVWNVGDPEARFRKACTLHLAVHAEMQLVNFYDQHPNVAPLFRFIGA
ncbi:uncharacterized protein PpBr36_11276 [Pyricularia pennisetigena]|uniref:uncharacterized protein n=1 Tax=Pyricularia pennisetigena TaxID=1578925 RepID=UPI001150C9FB|nr:uncharacterized protein PpBr36_11276 [Pyricularia pennisetigena]TLS20443.1 hypothetical protein PpBr36_11276 [Pyricularia pennisetigena]